MDFRFAIFDCSGKQERENHGGTEARRARKPEGQRAGKLEKNRLITNPTNGRMSRIIRVIR